MSLCVQIWATIELFSGGLDVPVFAGNMGPLTWGEKGEG